MLIKKVLLCIYVEIGQRFSKIGHRFIKEVYYLSSKISREQTNTYACIYTCGSR